MQRISCMLALAIMLTLSLATSSYGKIYSSRVHGNWESFILDSGEYGSIRIMTSSRQMDASLVVDFYPNMCQTGYIKIIQSCPGCSDFSKTLTLHGESRVDRRAIQYTSYEVEMYDGFIFISINAEDGHKLLKDFKEGQTVRFKMLVNGEPAYYRFSLVGFTAASNRAYNICKYASTDDDARYFEGRPDQPKSRQLPDAAYF